MDSLKSDSNSVISICIPVYNFKVDNLVDALIRQARMLDIPFEIILIDDCSEPAIQEHNAKLTQDGLRYVQLESNIGRASIRNRFLEYANYGHLLFLDCDSVIITDDFLANYIRSIQQYPDAVHCGGAAYYSEAPARIRRLRWKYGVKRECRPAALRALQPAKSFMTGNFAIPKKTLGSIRFDDRLKGYGHEDTLFGIELKRRQIRVAHLDNPVINGYLEENAGFLANTEKGIENLAFLLRNSEYGSEFVDEINLLRWYYKLGWFKKLVGGMFALVGPQVRCLLEKGIVNLYLFDFYKLGMLHQKMSIENRKK